MKKLFFSFYVTFIVLPIILLADWYGKNYVGEQMDDED